MKSAPIREFRANLAGIIEQDEPVIVTRHGRAAAVVYPLKNLRNVPAEVRNEIAEAVAREFAAEPQDEIIERYKKDVDRTLIRENLKRTPEESLRALEAMQALHDELRKAAGRSH